MRLSSIFGKKADFYKHLFKFKIGGIGIEVTRQGGIWGRRGFGIPAGLSLRGQAKTLTRLGDHSWGT